MFCLYPKLRFWSIFATSRAESPIFLARVSTSFHFQGEDLSINASNCSIETFPMTRSNRKGPGTSIGGASSSGDKSFAFHPDPGIREGRIHGVPAFWDNGVSLIFAGKSFLKRTIRRFPDRRRATWGACEREAGPSGSGESRAMVIGDSRSIDKSKMEEVHDNK